MLVEEDVPATLVPLDLTLRAAVDGAWLAVLEAAVPGTLRTTPMRLKVVCDHGLDRGAVVGDSGQGTGERAVQVALDADLPSINAMILDRLRGLR